MIVDGFKLMIIGMGYVMTFLAIMVLVIMLLAKALKPFAHLVRENAAASSRSPRRTAPETGNDKNLIAAAIAAVHRHRNKK
ncbi:MAG: OadG family protein [Victivallales bacterium]|nr:OadG family protein [Victivallales bacterium]